MSNARTSIDREIRDASIELGVRRDLHGKSSASYKWQRARVADLKQQRYEIQCDIARGHGRMVLA